VEQLVDADQHVGHPGARQPGLRHAIAPAVINGLLDFGQLPADVAHHRLGALAGSGVGRHPGAGAVDLGTRSPVINQPRHEPELPSEPVRAHPQEQTSGFCQWIAQARRSMLDQLSL
jgi:hypothetical protein